MGQQEFYSKHFQRNFTEMSDRYMIFLDIMRKYSPTKFLDVGCGDGSFSVFVKQSLNISEVYGVDISEEGIHIANRRGIKGCTLNIDSENLPFEDNFFDVIFCGEVIEHLYSPDHLLEELYRVLSLRGVLLLTTPNMASWFNRLSLFFGFQPIFTDVSLKYSYGHLWKTEPMGHMRLYTLKALKEVMESYHFKVLNSYGIGINYKIGFGKAHPVIARISNYLFRSPSLNSGILIVGMREVIKL